MKDQYHDFLESLTPKQIKAFTDYGMRVSDTLNDHYAKCQMPMRARILCDLRPRSIATLNWPMCFRWISQNMYCNPQKASRNVDDANHVAVAFPFSVQDQDEINRGIIEWENNYLIDKYFDRKDPPEIKRKRRTSADVAIERQAKLAMARKPLGRPKGSPNRKRSIRSIVDLYAPETFELTMWASRTCRDRMSPDQIDKINKLLKAVEKARA